MNSAEIQQAKQCIEAILKDSLAMFTNHPTKRNLTEKYNSDMSLAQSYHGRELLELIQNADDAYIGYESKDGMLNDVLVEYVGDTLRVSNRGKVFDKEAVERLSQGNVSGKGLQYIGNKGIGFRSLLNWAKEIRIYSGAYSFGFSKEFANKQFIYLRDNFDNVRREISDKPELSFPILWAPYWIDENKKEKDYDTTIEVLLDESALGDEWNVQKQIEEYDYNVLLFLQNITHISIKTSTEYYGFVKSEKEEEGLLKCILKKICYGGSEKVAEEKSYYCFKPEDEKIILGNSESLLKMTVAVPCSFEPMESKLYTFFPIKNESCPVPALLHATFLLEQNRSTISNNQLNQEIYKKLLDFYVESVTKAFTQKRFGNTVAKLLTPYIFPDKFESVSRFYFDLCKEKLSIMNVNGDFIPLSAQPCIYKDFPSFFKGEKFKLLCQSIDDSRVSVFLKELIGGDYKYKADNMWEIINACSVKWNVNQRVECFDWWLKEFNNDDWIPNLLKDRDGRWIVDEKKQVFFPPSEDLTSLPSWHGVVLLDRKDGDALDEYIRKSHAKKDKRDVINYLNYFNSISFREYSAESLIAPLKNAVDGDYQRAIDFIQWVRRNNKGASLTSSDKVFPCKDGSVQCAADIYLGEKYGKNSFIPFLAASGKFELELPEKILGEKEVKSKAEFESLKEFLDAFDFIDSPQIVKKELVYRSWWNSVRGDLSDVDKKYAEDAEEFLNEKDTSAEGESGGRRLFEVEITTVDNVCNILSEISTKQILEWIFGNGNNSAELRDKIFYQNDETIYYLPTASKVNYRKLGMRTDSYLWYAFAYTPWLSLGKSGKKYAPIECKFSSRNPLEKELVSESITDDFLESLSEELEIPSSDIKKLLERLGTDSYFLSLAPDSFYELLLKLPGLKNVGESIKFSHLIYNNCVLAISKGNWYVGRYADSPAGKKFQEKGKLLCKNDHSYRPVTEIYFSNSSVLNPLNKALFDIPLKNGRTDAIVDIFKVSRYDKAWESNIKVSSEDISALNEEFKKEWLNFIPYILCFLTELQQGVMIPKFKSLKIDLISNLRNELGEIIELQNDEYHLVEDDKHYYIYIGSDNLDKYKLSLAISDLLQKILDTENKDRLDLYAQLFRSDENSKKGLIQEYTYLDTLEDCINRFSAVNSDENPVVKYFTGLHIDIGNVENIFNRLYAGLGLKEAEQERLAIFLKNNGKDVSSIRLVLDQDNVSIVDYNRKQLKRKIEEKSQKELFEWALWRQCNKGDDADRINFRIRKDSLIREVLNTDVANTVYFEPFKKLEEVFQNMFGMSMNEFDFNPEQETSCSNVDELYQKNRNLLEFPEDVDENDFLDSKMKSLLYFDVELVQAKLNDYAEQKRNQGEEDDNSYNSAPLNVDIVYGSPLIVSAPRHSSRESHPASNSPKNPPKPNDEKLQNQGYEAERMVVAELRDRKISDINEFFAGREYSVEWKSKAAEFFEKTDGDDSLGYDVLLRSDDGKVLYIDVKSHEGEDCCFMMSANEVRYAKAHLTSEKDEYRIIFVSNFKLNAESITPSISVLPANFLDNPKFEKEYPNVRIFLKEG